MDSVIINKNLKNKSIYDKILRRMSKIRDRIETTISYYKASQLLFKNFYRDGRAIFQQLEQGSRNSNLYYSNKGSDLMAILEKMKQIICGFEKSSILNVERLDKFNQENTIKTHSALEAQTNKFYTHLVEYSKKSDRVQKKINEYNKQVCYIRQSISKYENFKDPICFYNPNELQKSIEKLDLKFKSLQEKETTLVGDIVIKMDKQYLCNSMKELKDVIFSVLNSQTSCFHSMVNIIVEGCKDHVDEECKLYRNSSSEIELYETQLANMNQIYNKLSANPNPDTDSFHNPFPVSIEVTEIDPNLKLYQQRCKNIIALRKSYLTSSQQLVGKIKVFIMKMMKSMEKNKKNYCDVVANTIGPSNKMEKFKKDIWKYLGENQIKKFNLSEIIISSHAKAQASILKKYAVAFKDLDKNISAKSHFFQQFQSKSSIAIDLHSSVKHSVQSQVTISQETFQRYQASIKDSFNELNHLFQTVKKQQAHLYNYIFKLCQDMASIYIKEISIVEYQYILNDHKDLFQSLKKRSEESEILNIMNNDERYQVLYNPFFLHTADEHRNTSCIRSEYARMRDLLEKKNYIAGIASKYENKLPGTMCCMARSPGDRIHPRVVTDCQLFNKADEISGTLKIYPESICFVPKKQFLRNEKITLIIPKKDIIDVEKKSITAKSENALEIETDMGNIVFHYVANIDEVYEILAKSIQKEVRNPISNQELNLSKSRISSYVKKNNSTTERHTPNTSFDKTKEIKIKRNKIRSGEIEISQSPSKMIIGCLQNEERSQQQPDLSRTHNLDKIHKGIEGFRITKEQIRESEIKRTYEIKLINLFYNIKEIRDITQSQSQISIKIKWNVECTSTSHKFQLSEKIVIVIGQEQIYMTVSIKDTEYLQSYVQGHFKKCVRAMNTDIMQTVAEEYNKVCELEVLEKVVGVDHVESSPQLLRQTYRTQVPLQSIPPIIHLVERNGGSAEFSQIIRRRESMREVVRHTASQKPPVSDEVKPINMRWVLIPLGILVLKVLMVMLGF